MMYVFQFSKIQLHNKTCSIINIHTFSSESAINKREQKQLQNQKFRDSETQMSVFLNHAHPPGAPTMSIERFTFKLIFFWTKPT